MSAWVQVLTAGTLAIVIYAIAAFVVLVRTILKEREQLYSKKYDEYLRLKQDVKTIHETNSGSGNGQQDN